MSGLRRDRPIVSMMWAAVVCAVGVLPSSPAQAQESVALFQVNGQNALTGDQGFQREDCDADRRVPMTLRLVGLSEPAYFLRMVQYDVGGPLAPCPNDLLEPVRVEVFEPLSVVPTGSEFSLEREFDIAELLGDDSCGAVGVRANVNLCLQLSVLPGDRQAVLTAGVPLDYDTTVPPAVDIADVTVTASPSDLVFDVPLPDTVERYDIVAAYRLCAEGYDEEETDDAADDGSDDGTGSGTGTNDGTDAEDDNASPCGATTDFTEVTSAESGTVTITGLPSGRDVEVRLSLVDDFGNEGPFSASGVFRTLVGVGPLGLYDGAGSDMSCAASCADVTQAASGFGFLLLVVSRRTRRAWRALSGAPSRGVSSAIKGSHGSSHLWLVLLVAVAAMGGARSAHASLGQMTVGMSVAPYTPAIDDERVDGRPIFPIYRCMFSNESALEFGGDFDTHVFDGFGSVQISLGLAVAQAQGKAQPSRGTECLSPADVDVQLSMLKIRPGVTYRFDPLLDWLGFPLVPYGRLGVVLQGYAFTIDGDFEQGNVDPVGLRAGWEAAGGLMLALDLLDSLDPFVPDTTRRARANGLFDHTFFFVEGAHQVVDGFGRPGFVFSPRDLFADTGLPILWRLGVAVELL